MLEQNKLAACPRAREESWKRTNPEIFFLPDDEVLNIQGQNALENKNKLCPWKICFRDFNQVKNLLTQVEKMVGADHLPPLEQIFEQEMKRLVVINISDGLADVYMSEEIKSLLEFMSTPWDVNPVTQNSPIAFALASRLKASCPHKIMVTVSGHSPEVPLFVVLNHCQPNYSQSYNFLHFLLKKNTKADLVLIDGGSAFSLFRQQLELEENSSLSQFWLNNPNSENDKTTYLERIVSLAENAKFKDAHIFIPKANLRITSHIQYNGIKSYSESGGAVIASKGKFDYEPIQEHAASHTKSNLNLKMILDKKAKASFQGLIIAKKDAQKCEAKQENKNILLSNLTRIDTEPRLEILPHDITCKHGSATAEIDKKQLYYLQSRGFSIEQARQIILKSFAQSSFSFLEEETVLQKIVESTLNYALH